MITSKEAITVAVLAVVGLIVWILRDALRTSKEIERRKRLAGIGAPPAPSASEDLEEIQDDPSAEWVDLAATYPKDRMTHLLGVPHWSDKQPDIHRLALVLTEKGIRCRIAPSERSRFGAVTLQVPKADVDAALTALKNPD